MLPALVLLLSRHRSVAGRDVSCVCFCLQGGSDEEEDSELRALSGAPAAALLTARSIIKMLQAAVSWLLYIYLFFFSLLLP